jgi:hypothetical protein
LNLKQHAVAKLVTSTMRGLPPLPGIYCRSVRMFGLLQIDPMEVDREPTSAQARNFEALCATRVAAIVFRRPHDCVALPQSNSRTETAFLLKERKAF